MQQTTTFELNNQRSEIHGRKSELAELKKQEHILIQNQLAQLALEQQHHLQKKLLAQQETRNDLDRFNRRKVKSALKAKKESLANDIVFLEGLRILEEDSRRIAVERREKIKIDTLQYMAYLKEMKAEEREDEMMREEMYQNESDAQWERRIKKWDDEKRKRNVLLAQVCEVRKKQVEESCNLKFFFTFIRSGKNQV